MRVRRRSQGGGWGCGACARWEGGGRGTGQAGSRGQGALRHPTCRASWQSRAICSPVRGGEGGGRAGGGGEAGEGGGREGGGGEEGQQDRLMPDGLGQQSPTKREHAACAEHAARLRGGGGEGGAAGGGGRAGGGSEGGGGDGGSVGGGEGGGGTGGGEGGGGSGGGEGEAAKQSEAFWQKAVRLEA